MKFQTSIFVNKEENLILLLLKLHHMFKLYVVVNVYKDYPTQIGKSLY